MANEDRIVGATIASKYRVRRIIGTGSMGVVCEAEHVDIGKRVAIKLIDASLAGMKEISLRFRQEARAASLVESQHIVQVFDVGADDVLGLYLVMEFLVGEDLAKVLARERRLPPARAVRIAVQVARGLARAHEAGVVHRDLKPANIFLCARDEDDEPTAKILDFGISKLVASSRPGGAAGLNLTRDGMVVGTPQYMSPEQAQGFVVDARTDVWSLGLVLYEMLAGRPAYPELPSYERFIIHLVSEPPEPIRQVAPWVSEELAAVVHRALEHDLDRRVPSCAELVRRLVEVDPLVSGPHTRGAAGASGTPAVADVPDTLVMSDRPGVPAAMAAGAIHRLPAPVPDRAPAAPDESGAVPSSRASPSWLGSSGVRGAVRATPHLADDFEQEAPQFFDRRMLQSLGGTNALEPSPPASSPSTSPGAPATAGGAPGGTSLERGTARPAVGAPDSALGAAGRALPGVGSTVGALPARRSWPLVWVVVLLALVVLVAVAAVALR